MVISLTGGCVCFSYGFDCCPVFLEQSVEVLFDSLRQLQLMHVSLETLKVRLESLFRIIFFCGILFLIWRQMILSQVTDIGKSVKVLQTHTSMEIRNLVTALMEYGLSSSSFIVCF